MQRFAYALLADYMHARYCSPLMVRFLAVDPIGADAAMPASWNRYSYVYGNPLNYTDPTGMFGAAMVGILPLIRILNTPIFFDSITVADEASDRTYRVRFFLFDRPGLSGGSIDGGLDEEPVTIVDTLLSEIPIDGVEYGNCVRSRRFEPLAALSVLGSAVPKRLVPPFRVPDPKSPLTTPASVAAHYLRGRSPRAAHVLRTGGRLASRIALPVTVFEGYYDIGTLIRCGFEKERTDVRMKLKPGELLVLLVGLLIVVILLASDSPYRRYHAMAVFLLVSLGAWMTYRFVQKRRLASLDDVAFANLCQGNVGVTLEELAECRRYLGLVLGVPYQKLRPDHTIGFLIDHFEFLGDVQVGWSNLEDELGEACAEAGISRLQIDRGTSVQEFLHALIKCKPMATVAPESGPS